MNGLNTSAPIIDALAALADPIRGRILLALERHELAVGELAAALQLPQSTVSRHLKTLVDAGWVASRAEGTSRHYRLAQGSDGTGTSEQGGGPPRALWRAVRGPLATLAATAHDDERLRAVVAERRSASQAFFSQSAAAWDRLRVELFGARAELFPLLTLVDDSIVVGDLGCGTGAAAEALAPFVQRCVAVDRSAAMLAVAAQRLEGCGNVELREGDLEALPLEDGALDVALLGLVLHHIPEPWTVIAEAARVVRPGGRVVVIDMLPHDRESYRQQMGHVWLGFSRAQLEPWLAEAGLMAPRFVTLPPDPAGKGPPLFTASARRPLAASHAPGREAVALTSRTLEFA
jgi:ArsR family transcriptional regulator